MSDDAVENEQLASLVTGEIDRQLKERNDVLDGMKAQMSKVIKEFEDLTTNLSAKRSWMRSVSKAGDTSPTNTSGLLPIVATSDVSPSTSPSRLPKLGGFNKKRKKLQLQLPSPDGVSDARSPDGKIVFDKKLPRVANMEKRADVAQAMLASQQRQLAYEKAFVRFPLCRSSIFAPSIYDDAPLTANDPPKASLQLDFIYGFHNGAAPNGIQIGNTNFQSSSAGNAVYLSSGEILWYSTTIVILFSKETNTQRYFCEHTNEVTSVGVHPNRYVVATGQAGREAFLLVWNTRDQQLGRRFACLKGHRVAVRCINFSHDGKLVVSLGGDMYNTICVHDWKEQTLLATARGHSFRVHMVAFNPYQAYGRPETRREKKPGQALDDDDVCYTLVSCGVRHIRFWTLTKTDYEPPITETSEDSVFFGTSFGGPSPRRPPTLHGKVWKLEGNVPSFHGRLDVQDFTSVTFVDDSPPFYLYNKEREELVATRTRDHSLGRIVAGSITGDLCLFWQPRKSPPEDSIPENKRATEPAKWWEIPDEYSDADINELVLEKIAFEPSARLVDVAPHDLDTGNRFKLSKQMLAEIDGIKKQIAMKPNTASLNSRLQELKYGGSLAHQGAVCQVSYCRKTNLVMSCGADGRLLLWRCQLSKPMRVPGVNTHGVFTPLDGSFAEGSHALAAVMNADGDAQLVFQLPAVLPCEGGFSPPNNSTSSPKPTSIAWKEDGTCVLVGTSTNCLWELDITTGAWQLVFEARSGAITACACHPTLAEVATLSQDGYLCTWDLQSHRCNRRFYLGSVLSTGTKAVCVEIHPFGDEIAIGLSSGELLVVDYKTWKVLFKKVITSRPGAAGVTDAQANHALARVKYSPNAKFLAVGSKDTFVYIYDVPSGYKKLSVCDGHSSALMHLTWSADGTMLLSNTTDGEVLYWSISPTKGESKQITDTFSIRDTQWAKWSCAFGWSTPGIWSEDMTNAMDVAAITTTSQHGGKSPRLGQGEDLLAAACKTSIQLFKWPVPRGSRARTFVVHSSLIAGLSFSADGQHLLSAGGDDATLIQWTVATQSGPSSSSLSPAPSPSLSPRKPTIDLELALDIDAGDGDTGLGSATTPQPTPPAEKSQHGQRSPRQQARVRRERQESDVDTPTILPSVAESTDSPFVTSLNVSRSAFDLHDNTAEQMVDEEGNSEAADEEGAAEDAQSANEAPDSSSPPAARPEPTHVRVKHAFDAQNADELSLQSGELIRVLSRNNREWWLGEACDGRQGIFPADFVTPVDEEYEGNGEFSG